MPRLVLAVFVTWRLLTLATGSHVVEPSQNVTEMELPLNYTEQNASGKDIYNQADLRHQAP